MKKHLSEIPWLFQYFVQFFLTFPVCSKLPDFSPRLENGFPFFQVFQSEWEPCLLMDCVTYVVTKYLWPWSPVNHTSVASYKIGVEAISNNILTILHHLCMKSNQFPNVSTWLILWIVQVFWGFFWTCTSGLDQTGNIDWDSFDT